MGIALDLDNNQVNFYKNTNIDSLFFYCDKLEKSSNICKRLEGQTGRAYGYYRDKKYSESERIVLKVIHTVDSLNKQKENKTR